ncbi:Uncharacterised protein [Vibrio cholerae]|nr:Uncharacterised protein [Vibrio cholerae]
MANASKNISTHKRVITILRQLATACGLSIAT